MSPKVLLLEMVVLVTAGKYVYEKTPRNWFEAQRHCRNFHSDLASVSSDYDNGLIGQLDLYRFTGAKSWIGLMNTTNSKSGWVWSGGGEVTKFFWAPNEPNDHIIGEDFGASMNYGQLWIDIPGSRKLPFICYSVHAIRESMTWDDALQYCRKNHHDLASVSSETEMAMMEKELGKDLSSLNVWIGLRFLDGTWRWVDSQPFSYESWGTLSKPICPDFNFACGALQVQGKKGEKNTLYSVGRVVGWNANDCNQKLHFLCY